MTMGVGREPSREENIDTIARLLIRFWPMMRKRLIYLSDIQAECNMPISHIQMLVMLSEEESLSISEISERFEIAKPNITPMIDRMITEGLVRRMHNQRDKRVVSIQICDAGRERLKSIYASVHNLVTRWAGRLEPEELVQLASSLNTLTTLITKSTENGR